MLDLAEYKIDSHDFIAPEAPPAPDVRQQFGLSESLISALVACMAANTFSHSVYLNVAGDATCIPLSASPQEVHQSV